ncbi:MAG: carbohydrate-binding protein [Bacteroidales bacterium]|nr:carbohydrate-binding protein [Bacteroidales bacterium]
MASLMNGSFSDTCVVTVNSVSVTSVNFEKDTIILKMLTTGFIKAFVEPENAIHKKITFSSENDTIVSVDSTGFISAKKEGTTAIVATSDEGGFTDTCWIVVPPVVREAFGGNLRSIPGKIEAEDFDDGIEGLSYHDESAANEGNQYRNTVVDIESCSDEGNGFNVGWLSSGEWLLYLVKVEPGTYDVRARVASPDGGSQFDLLVDETKIASFTAPQTGGWQDWATVSNYDVVITGGDSSTLKFLSNSSGFNINYFEFLPGIALEEIDINQDTLKLEVKKSAKSGNILYSR